LVIWLSSRRDKKMERLARGMQYLRLSETLESGEVTSKENQRRLSDVKDFFESVHRAGAYYVGKDEGFTSDDRINHQELCGYFSEISRAPFLSCLKGHIAVIERILVEGKVCGNYEALDAFCKNMGQRYVNAFAAAESHFCSV